MFSSVHQLCFQSLDYSDVNALPCSLVPGLEHSDLQLGIMVRKGVGGTTPARQAGRRLRQQGFLPALLDPMPPQVGCSLDLVRHLICSSACHESAAVHNLQDITPGQLERNLPACRPAFSIDTVVYSRYLCDHYLSPLHPRSSHILCLTARRALQQLEPCPAQPQGTLSAAT